MMTWLANGLHNQKQHMEADVQATGSKQCKQCTSTKKWAPASSTLSFAFASLSARSPQKFVWFRLFAKMQAWNLKSVTNFGALHGASLLNEAAALQAWHEAHDIKITEEQRQQQ
jgi:hypothetical protein